MDARRTHEPIDDLPEELRPTTVDEAYFIQDRLSLVYGTVGGWKVGAPTPEATPMFAPIAALADGSEWSGDQGDGASLPWAGGGDCVSAGEGSAAKADGLLDG